MPKISLKLNKAIISGWNLKKMRFWRNTQSKIISTPYGRVNYFQLADSIFIPRHGIKENIPPHKINYWANLFAIKKLGIKYIFAVNSVGSLKKKIKPGYFIVASDYIHLNPPTFYGKQAKFIIPELSTKLRKVLIKILRKLRIKFNKNGIYFQTKGPRFETKAEIKLLKNFADVVGMTMANEATLADELGLEYISLCSIDNYAHGVVKKPFMMTKFRGNQLKMVAKIEKIIEEIIKTKIR